MPLSEDLKNQLILGDPVAYYRAEPNEKYKGTFYYESRYNCRNWIFFPKVCSNGDIRMVDTYWSNIDESILLTDDNFHEFEFLFRKGEASRIDYYDADLYDPKDVFYDISLGSWGEKHTFVRKGAKKIPENVLRRLQYDLEGKFYSLKQALSELNSHERTMGLPETTLESFLLKNLL